MMEILSRVREDRVRGCVNRLFGRRSDSTDKEAPRGPALPRPCYVEAQLGGAHYLGGAAGARCPVARPVGTLVALPTADISAGSASTRAASPFRLEEPRPR